MAVSAAGSGASWAAAALPSSLRRRLLRTDPVRFGAERPSSTSVVRLARSSRAARASCWDEALPYSLGSHDLATNPTTSPFFLFFFPSLWAREPTRAPSSSSSSLFSPVRYDGSMPSSKSDRSSSPLLFDSLMRPMRSCMPLAARRRRWNCSIVCRKGCSVA